MSETNEGVVRENRATSESPRRTLGITTNPTLPTVELPGYAELQQQIHDALRAQHPEWVQPNGDSPTCDSYEFRFAELLWSVARSPVNKKCVKIRNFCGATSTRPLDDQSAQRANESLTNFTCGELSCT
ncbi:MAG: hypothetical protein ACM3NN_12015 [Nitrospirota bacterium]